MIVLRHIINISVLIDELTKKIVLKQYENIIINFQNKMQENALYLHKTIK